MSVKNLIMSAAGASTGNPNAWDVSKAVYDAGPDAGDVSNILYAVNYELNTSAQDSSVRAIYIKPDGLSLYASIAGRVWQYTLSTAWCLIGATYASKNVLHNSQVNVAEGLFFKSDGTKMYLVGVVSVGIVPTVFQYSLSTAWDVSTASYDSVSFVVAEAQPRGLFFKPDGTKMYITGVTDDDVKEYNLSSAWDLSTTSYVQNFSISAQEINPSGVSFLQDGTKMYICGQTGDDISEYALSTPWDISTSSYTRSDTAIISPKTITPVDLFLKPDASMVFVVGDRDAFNNTISKVFQFVFGSLLISTEELAPTGIFFKIDGTKMYLIGQTGDDVNEYDLSTAWDITTASYLQNFSIASQETNPTGLCFKDDGTKMYVCGTTGQDVNEYALSSAWDVSTASYTINFSVSSQDATVSDVQFSLDGTKMYIVGTTSDAVYQYSLSTAWSISSASYSTKSFSVASQENSPTGIFFKPDGTKMYVTGVIGDDVNEYNLSSAWDISTASYVQNSPRLLDSSPQGIYWRDNGEEFFIVGGTTDIVQKYRIPSE
jgi:sugar lactone lactonase YvrE